MTRTHHTRTLLLALVVLTAFTVAPAAVAAQDGPPPAPASYYGDVTIDGDPAPAGVEIVAYVDGEERGSYLTEASGEYGSPSAFDENLVVQGTADDEGEPVEFTVNGQLADATVEWEAGAVENVDLSASLSGDPGDEDPGDGGDDGEAAGGGGGGGGVAPGGQPTPPGGDSTTERVDASVTTLDEDDWTVSVSADSVAADATVDADLDGTIAADGVSVDELSVTVGDDVDEFGLSARTLAADGLPDDIEALDTASAVSYAEFKLDGFESATVTEAEFSFSVDESALPDATAPEHVSLYRFADGWEEVPTAYNGDGEYVATSEGFSVFAIGAGESGVAVTTATLEAPEIEPGDLAAVSATVENTGDVEGTTAVALQVDGETVDERRVTVDAGETREVTFTPQFEAEGEFTISVGDETAGDLVVETLDDETTDAEDADGDAAADDGDTDATEILGLDPLALVGVLAVVLVVLGAFAVRRR